MNKFAIFVSFVLASMLSVSGSQALAGKLTDVLVTSATGGECEGGFRFFSRIREGNFRYVNNPGINWNLRVSFNGNQLGYEQGDTADTIGRFAGTILSTLNDGEQVKLEKALELYRTYKFARQAAAERVKSGLLAGRLIVVRMNQANPRFDVWLILPDDRLLAVVFRAGEKEPSYIAFVNGCRLNFSD